MWKELQGVRISAVDMFVKFNFEATEGGINDGDRRPEYRSEWKSDYLTLQE
jgi:hypothetical protein